MRRTSADLRWPSPPGGWRFVGRALWLALLWRWRGADMKVRGFADADAGIRLHTLWLDDVHERQRERRLLDALLHRALEASSGEAQGLQALSLVLPLLDLLPQIERSLLGRSLGHAAGEHLRLLAEQLQTRQPDDPLLLAELTQVLQLLDVQVRLQADQPPDRHESLPPTPAQEALLHRRQALLHEAERWLEQQA